MNDLALLERWRVKQDAEAFNAIASRYSGMVYATSKRILGNPADAGTTFASGPRQVEVQP